jgi:hypothetical protein
LLQLHLPLLHFLQHLLWSLYALLRLALWRRLLRFDWLLIGVFVRVVVIGCFRLRLGSSFWLGLIYRLVFWSR